MKTRSFAFTAVFALLFNIAAFAAVDKRPKAKKRQVNRLVTLLPASDGVAIFDSKRFFGDALPKVLAANQPLLSEIMAKVNEIQDRTGIDLRKFDQAAVGVRYPKVSAKETDYEPVVVASGEIDFGALVAAAKSASNANYRSELVGDKSMFIFTAKDVVLNKPATPANSKISGIADHVSKGLPNEIALAAIDRNTVAVGLPSRVRETLEAKSRIGADVTGLLPVRETAVVSFAMRTRGGMAQFLPLDNDELGKNIESIQYLAGVADVTADGTSLHVMARTQKAGQAEQLKDTLDVLRLMGKGFLGASKAADKQVYGRMLANARFTHRGTDVTLDLLVPQADIDALIATIK